jgi:hypothetical protein
VNCESSRGVHDIEVAVTKGQGLVAIPIFGIATRTGYLFTGLITMELFEIHLRNKRSEWVLRPMDHSSNGLVQQPPAWDGPIPGCNSLVGITEPEPVRRIPPAW